MPSGSSLSPLTMGMSSRAGRAPLGRLRVTTTAPSWLVTLRTPPIRPENRELSPMASRREAAASSAVRGLPSEKVTPERRVKVQVRPSSLTV